MNPDDLEATLELVKRGRPGFSGVRHHELMTFLATYRPKPAQKETATSKNTNVSTAGTLSQQAHPSNERSSDTLLGRTRQMPATRAGNACTPIASKRSAHLASPGGEFSPQVAAYPPPASPQTVSTAEANRQILITQELPILPNSNFRWEDSRRVCRFCNIATPSLAQFKSHSMGKKHLKNVEYFHRMGCLKKEIQDIVDAGRALWQLPPPGSRGSRLCSRNLTDSQKSAADEINERDLCEFCPVCSLKLTSRAHARDHYRGKPHDKQFRKKTLERQIPKKVVYALERINDDIDKTWQSEFIVYSKMVRAY
ncbi:unnamed protein product [Oikopleura dioica]|uniref:U1-type domain-containing protein n=1 Tax=Oikopleura dioica TaxID=34765 RepID=E4XKY8_OIKDI|nr:unnamed protein product [Oikopleura dioica]